MMANKLEVKIKEIIQRTYNVKSFRLDVGDNIDFIAGQFLHVTLKIGESYMADRYLSISSIQGPGIQVFSTTGLINLKKR